MATKHKVTQVVTNPDHKEIFVNGISIATHQRKWLSYYNRKGLVKAKYFNIFKWNEDGLSEVLGDEKQAFIDQLPFEPADPHQGVTGEFFIMKGIKEVLKSEYYS